MAHPLLLFIDTKTNAVANFVGRGTIVEVVNKRRSKYMNKNRALAAYVGREIGTEDIETTENCPIVDVSKLFAHTQKHRAGSTRKSTIDASFQRNFSLWIHIKRYLMLLNFLLLKLSVISALLKDFI